MKHKTEPVILRDLIGDCPPDHLECCDIAAEHEINDGWRDLCEIIDSLEE